MWRPVIYVAFLTLVLGEANPVAIRDRNLLKLVTRDQADPSKLQVVEESLEWLTQRLEKPVFVVSVLGGFHTGKSFLLNQLSGMGSGGFEVTPSIDPTTAGIDMAWTKLGEETDVLWLDTEGFAAAENSGDYDAKLFAVAATLSSQLIYNSLSNINQNDVAYLEQLARRAQLFATKTGLTHRNSPSSLAVAITSENFTSSIDGGSAAMVSRQVDEPATALIENDDGGTLSLPPLWWVVQSFHMKLRDQESANEWLDRILDESANHLATGESGSLKNIFKQRRCHTLNSPTASAHPDSWYALHATEFDGLSPHYREQLGKLQSDLITALLTSGTRTTRRTGREISELVRMLVDGANAGNMVAIPSIWQMMIESQVHQAADQAKDLLERRLGSLSITPPLTRDQFTKEANSQVEDCLSSYRRILFGLQDVRVTRRGDRLSEEASALANAASLRNDESIREAIAEACDYALDEARNMLRKIRTPQPRKAVSVDTAKAKHTASELLETRAPRDYGPQLREGQRNLLRDVDVLIRAKESDNDDAIKKVYEQAKNSARRKYRETASAYRESNPAAEGECYTFAEFSPLTETAERLSIQSFESDLGRIKGEPETRTMRKALSVDLREVEKAYVKSEKQCVERLAQATALRLAKKRRELDYEVKLRAATPFDRRTLHKILDNKEAEDARMLDKKMARYLESDHPKKEYKIAVSIGQTKLREKLAEARTQILRINTEAWASLIEEPLEDAADIIRSLDSLSDPLMSPITNLRFRSRCKGLASERVEKRAGKGRISKEQLKEVIEEWLSGSLKEIPSSAKVNKILQRRERFAGYARNGLIILAVLLLLFLLSLRNYY